MSAKYIYDDIVVCKCDARCLTICSVSVPLPVYMFFREACYSIHNADLPPLGDIIRHVDTMQSIFLVY
jgi:hypothetical protein